MSVALITLENAKNNAKTKLDFVQDDLNKSKAETARLEKTVEDLIAEVWQLETAIDKLKEG